MSNVVLKWEGTGHIEVHWEMVLGIFWVVFSWKGPGHVLKMAWK